MRAVQRQPISLLDSWPAPDTDAVRQALREELRRFDRKVVVLDDDPTGVQTVHDTRTSRSRHSSGVSPGSICPPTPIHLPAFSSFSRPARCSISHSPPRRI